MRITPEKITHLDSNQIFVFGSNQLGRHGKGAAKTALNWGAIYGQAEGLQGKTYAIPTKNKTVRKTLHIDEIEPYVFTFIDFAKSHPKFIFLVTEIGCGLAGLTPKEVAPLFIKAKEINNIWLPKRFWNIIYEN